MKTLQAQLLLTSPLAHGAERGPVRPENLPKNAGNNYTPFRSMPFATQLSNDAPTISLLPVVTGNSFRGKGRRAGANLTLDALQINPKNMSASVYYFLYSGGGLSQKLADENDQVEENGKGFPLLVRNRLTLRSTFPLLSLFGASYGNKMIEGLMSFGQATPIFAETVHITGIGSDRHWDPDLLSYQLYTRKDDLTGDNDLEAATAIITSDKKILKEAKEENDSKQMIYYIEILAPGVSFEHSISLRDGVTPIEESLVALILNNFRENPFIGGKSGTGHGRVNFPEFYDLSKLEPGTTYLNWLRVNETTIKAYMECWANPKGIIKLADDTKPFDVKKNPISIMWPAELSEKLDELVAERELLTQPTSLEALKVMEKYR